MIFGINNWSKLGLILSLMFSVFTLRAMAQEKPMEAKALAALITDLKEVVSKNAPNQSDAQLIGNRWDARQDLTGKNKSQVIELLYGDVKAVIKDSGVQYQIYSIFVFYKRIPDKQSSGSNESPEAEDFTDPRDGHVYGIKKLGNLTWMKENLRFNVPNASWCFDNDGENCAELGRLYTFQSALKACPFGWRLPSDNDWLDLEKALGLPQDQWMIDGYSTARGGNVGQKLKAGGSSGLEFKISGYASIGSGDPKFDGIDNDRPRSYFWTATSKNVNNQTIAVRRRIEENNGYIFRFSNPAEGYAVAVRCVQ
jgi:uncharacterized protein (TIGR02145 family)